MTAWEAYPDQIRANLDAFTAASDVEVELSLIPNVGYVLGAADPHPRR